MSHSTPDMDPTKGREPKQTQLLQSVQQTSAFFAKFTNLARRQDTQMYAARADDSQMICTLQCVLGRAYLPLQGLRFFSFQEIFFGMYTVPAIIIVNKINIYLRETVITTVTTCQYTMQVVVTNCKLPTRRCCDPTIIMASTVMQSSMIFVTCVLVCTPLRSQ